jgi:hypothetical protein
MNKPKSITVNGETFTEEDVALLLNEATMRGFMAMDNQECPLDRRKQTELNDLAARLSRALNPETP